MVSFDFITLHLTNLIFRGVKEFKVEISDNFGDYKLGSWKRILQKTLEDHSNKQDVCGVPIMEYNLPEFYNTRFVRFYALAYFGDGVALQHFSIE